MLLSVLLCLVLLAVDVLASSGTRVASPARWTYTPVHDDIETGFVQIRLSLTPATDDFSPCGQLEVTILPQDGMRYVGEDHWFVSFDDTNQYSRLLELYLPPNDTSALFVRLGCVNTGYSYTAKYCFVSTADSIEYWNGYPRAHFPEEPPDQEIDVDTLKESDLDAEYEVYLDVKTPEKLSKAKSLLRLELSPDARGFARVKVSLRLLFELAKQGLEWDFVVRPSWWRHDNDTTSEEVKMIRKQGRLDETARPYWPGVSLSGVEGLIGSTSLPSMSN